MLHPDLQRLLDFALESGEVTEKHKQILRNKAVALNQDLDELDMIIEGEIRRLIKGRKNEKHKNNDCPNCGNSIPNSAIKCSYCGYELSKLKATGEDYIMKLQTALSKLDDDWSKEKHSIGAFGGIKGDPTGTQLAQKKFSVISTFTMPNDKENLLEFFHFCHGNYEGNYSKRFIIDYYARVNQQNINNIAKAFQGKAKSAYEKLKRFVDEDEDIKKIVIQFKSKYDK